jgi:hypothetical protein
MQQKKRVKQRYSYQCCPIPAKPSPPPRPLTDISRPPKFFIPAHIHSHISGFISCHFYSFSTQILLFLAFLLLSLCLVLLVSLAGVPVATGILAVANIPAVACFPAVAGVL